MRYRLTAGWLCLCLAPLVMAADQKLSTDSPTDQTETKNQRLALTADQIARGQAIRGVLVRGIDFAHEHGAWPKELSELKGANTPPLVYLGPPPANFDGVERHLRGELKSVTPAVHEPIEKHPDGVWVGYADGHIELVRDVASLGASLAQSARAVAALYKTGQISTRASTPAAKADAKLILKVVDNAGRPVAGARVGNFLWHADYDLPHGRDGLDTYADKLPPQATTSDAEGRVEIQYQWFFFDDDPPETVAPLIAYHQDRGLIAVATFQPAAFHRGPAGEAPAIELKLQRGAKLHGTLSRISAPASVDESIWTNAYIYLLASGPPRPMASLSTHQQFEFLLPPGDYLIQAYGDGAYNAYRRLHVADSDSEIHLHLDLPADQLTLLTGKQAPALRQIKAWKNGGPVSLDQLRGKWVLLDFWGYWCGPCVGSMPALMDLYDKYHDKGLVIIGVHDDSVASIEEMDKNLEQTRKELWKGRDLPFPVALDGGGELPISGTERSTKGATHAAYGIQHWPTTILIDPQGNVVGEKSANDLKLKELLEKELSR
jgi:thiol-disulfide isomerase/thioredoxin